MKISFSTTTAILALALCACEGAPLPASSPPAPTPPASVTSSAAPLPSLPRLEAACAELDKKQRATIAQAKSPEGGGDAMMDADLALLPKELGQCVRSGRGAWAVVIADMAPSPEGTKGSLEGAVYFVHLDENGVAAESGNLITLLAPGTTGYPFGSLRFRTRLAHDLDGKGSDELLVCADFVSHQPISGMGGQFAARPTTGCKVLTRDGDFVMEYAEAVDYEIEDFKDVDQDGRPDILTRTPFAAIVGLDDDDCALEICNTAASRGPLLAAHAQPDGTFSFAHEAATKFAMQECASRPKTIFASSGMAAADFPAGVNRFVCALMWGATAAELAPELKKARAAMCKTPSACQPFDDLEQKANDSALSLPRMKR